MTMALQVAQMNPEMGDLPMIFSPTMALTTVVDLVIQDLLDPPDLAGDLRDLPGEEAVADFVVDHRQDSCVGVHQGVDLDPHRE